MKTKDITARITLVPPTDTSVARLQIVDRSSEQLFLEIDLPPGALENLIYGKVSDCTTKVYGVGKVLGHKKVMQSRTTPYPGSVGDDVGLIRKWLVTNKQEADWIIDPNVRPTNFHQLGGFLYLTYNVYRFEKP